MNSPYRRPSSLLLLSQRIWAEMNSITEIALWEGRAVQDGELTRWMDLREQNRVLNVRIQAELKAEIRLIIVPWEGKGS